MKYIIEFEDMPSFSEDGIDYYQCKQVTWWFASYSIIGKLTSAQDILSEIEEIDKKVDEAYQRGYKDCETRYCSFDACPNRQAEYRRGLNDAWEAAKKIFGYVRDGGIPIDEIGKIFGYAEDAEFCTADIIRHNTASEAIERLKAYEEKQNDKIKVGDEVEPFYTDITGVVTLIDGDTIYILWRDGSSTSAMKLKEVTKTGRHFDIASILEDMRND